MRRPDEWGKLQMFPTSFSFHTICLTINAEAGEVVGRKVYSMTIEELFDRFNKEFLNDSSYTFKRDFVFSVAETNDRFIYASDIAVDKNGLTVMIIKHVKDSKDKDRQFYLYQHYNPDVYFYAVFYDDSFWIKEKPYLKINKEERSMFQFDDTIPFDFTEIKNVTFDNVVRIIKEFDHKNYSISKEMICKVFNDCAVSQGIDISSYLESIDENNIEYNNKEYWLDRNSEIKLITYILNDGKSIPSTLYRYTSVRSLERIFCEKERPSVHGMSSLVAMNDTTEVDYANNYLCKKYVEINKKELEKERNSSMHVYITSFSDKEDDLTMWRLYGDNAKGVCIVYDKSEELSSPYYMLARVSYANKDKYDEKLDFIADLMMKRIGNREFKLRQWYIWQHFFKPYEYNVESEVRLLAFVDEITHYLCNYERKWFTTSNGIYMPVLQIPLKTNSEELLEYPLTIKGIILGCKFIEKETNKISWEYKIKDENGDSVHRDFNVCISQIDNYR